MKFDKFLEFVVDTVFSGFTLMLVLTIGFFALITAIIQVDMERHNQRQKMTEFCYSQNMVLVNTDAGDRCVAPQSLVKVK